MLDDAARDRLAQAGFDPVYGARPLKRAIQQQLENPLAQRILRGDFGPGDTIRVTASSTGLDFARGVNARSDARAAPNGDIPDFAYQIGVRPSHAPENPECPHFFLRLKRRGISA